MTVACAPQMAGAQWNERLGVAVPRVLRGRYVTIREARMVFLRS
jgi:hypothetical protein